MGFTKHHLHCLNILSLWGRIGAWIENVDLNPGPLPAPQLCKTVSLFWDTGPASPSLKGVKGGGEEKPIRSKINVYKC